MSKKYILDEIDAIKENIILAKNKLKDSSLTALDRKTISDVKQTLEDVLVLFEDKNSDELVIENIYSKLSGLYLFLRR